MAIIRPFRGLRPRPELAAKVVCPPYDVLSRDEARKLAGNEPHSFLKVNKAELEFDDSVSPYSDKVYKRGRENLERFISDGVMIRDESDCLYLYRLTLDGRSQIGLVTLASVHEYNDGKIKKHEHTRPDKVNDRANHIIALGAQVGPVLSAFRQNNSVTEIFNKVISEKAQVDFSSSDGVRHELWVISDSGTIKSLVDAFSGIDALYIADGHHRSEAAAKVLERQDENKANEYFLTVLFDDSELTIMAYNRVVKDLSEKVRENLLERVAESFEVESSDDAVVPSTAHQFGLYFGDKWYRLTALTNSFDSSHATESIDTAILAANLIEPVLGISDPRTDHRINFVGGIRGTEELVRLVDSSEYQAAFSLYPTSVEQLLQVADAGEVMPPKSTWFEPKLRTGMVVNMLNHD